MSIEPEDTLDEDGTTKPGDTLGLVAVGLGLLGIVFFGILMAIVTAVVATEAGKRAKAEKRPLDNAYIALVLAAVDGIVWIVIQLLLDVPIAFG